MSDDIEYDTECTDAIVCPHCGYEFENSWEFFSHSPNSTDIDCDRCERTFSCSQEVVVSYTTRKKGGAQ